MRVELTVVPSLDVEGQVALDELAAPLAVVIVELAQAAAAGLALRDADAGFARVPSEQRALLSTRAQTLPELVATVVERWDAVAALAPLLDGLTVGEQVLLALVTAPELDRATARTLRRVLDEPVLTVGALCDLASDDLEARLALLARLDGAAPLVRSGALIVTSPVASAPIAVAPWVVAAVRAA